MESIVFLRHSHVAYSTFPRAYPQANSMGNPGFNKSTNYVQIPSAEVSSRVLEKACQREVARTVEATEAWFIAIYTDFEY
jgi:hypothetical protein